MPYYSDEELTKFRKHLIFHGCSNETEWMKLANDLIAARARIAELERALEPFVALANAEDDRHRALRDDGKEAACCYGGGNEWASATWGDLRHAAAALKGQSNEP